MALTNLPFFGGRRVRGHWLLHYHGLARLLRDKGELGAEMRAEIVGCWHGRFRCHRDTRLRELAKPRGPAQNQVS